MAVAAGGRLAGAPVRRRLPRRHGPVKAAAQVAQAPKTASRLAPFLATLACLALALAHRHLLRNLALHNELPTSQLVAAVHAAAFLLIVLVQAGLSRHRRGTSVKGHPLVSSPFFVAAVAVIELLNWAALGQVGASGALGIELAALSGSLVPFCMLMSTLILRRGFGQLAWMGAALVAVGVALYGPTPISITAQQALLIGATCTLSGLALIGKEALVGVNSTGFATRQQQRGPLTVPMVALLATAAQLVALLVLPHGLPAAPSVPSLSWLVGASPPVLSTGMLAYLAVSGLYRLTLVWTLRVASAPVIELVNAVAVPTGTALWALSLGGTVSLWLPWHSAAGLALCACGAALYSVDRPRLATGIFRTPEQLAAAAAQRVMQSEREKYQEELRLATAQRRQLQLDASKDLRRKQEEEQRRERLIEAWKREDERMRIEDTERLSREEEAEKRRQEAALRQEVEEEVEARRRAQAGLPPKGEGGAAPLPPPAPRLFGKLLGEGQAKQERKPDLLSKMWKEWMASNRKVRAQSEGTADDRFLSGMWREWMLQNRKVWKGAVRADSGQSNLGPPREP